MYYFLSYFHVIRNLPEKRELQYVVPTGNFGDILAGYYAKRMGLPIASLVIATNENDILTRFWRTGRYEKVSSDSTIVTSALDSKPMVPAGGASDGKQASSEGGVKATLSPAMDILVSSNFERLLWYLAYETSRAAGRKAACNVLAQWMSEVKSDGRVALPISVLELARHDFLAERISDEQVRFLIPADLTGLSQFFMLHLI